HLTAPPASGSAELEWCARRLLSRIHRRPLRRLRAEIEPVSPSVLMRFLLRWGHVAPGTQMHGKDGLMRVIGQLQGLELPAPAWEERILPARIQRYNPADLEHLCLSGVVTWGRLSTGGAAAADGELDEDLPPKARSRRRRDASDGIEEDPRSSTGERSIKSAERDELVARQLLRRYGVVFRDLLVRERNAPPWRVLLPVLRRLEARGEIRGGRFVNG